MLACWRRGEDHAKEVCENAAIHTSPGLDSYSRQLVTLWFMPWVISQCNEAPAAQGDRHARVCVCVRLDVCVIARGDRVSKVLEKAMRV